MLDVDKLGHSAIESRKEAIITRFGEDVLSRDGSVDRRLLGEKVFGKEDELAALQAIVHPEANRLTMEWVAAQNGGNCVVNAAVLHKSAAFDQLDCVILVSAPWFVRLVRAKRRDRLPWVSLIRRFSSQHQFHSQYSSGNADIYKVGNSGIAGSKWVERRIDTILTDLGRVLYHG